jgi:hypothetical protein
MMTGALARPLQSSSMRRNQMPMLRTIDGPKEIKIGQTVGFKSDVEQYGKVIAINGASLRLSNPNGFDGGYIGGQTETWVTASDCWID